MARRLHAYRTPRNFRVVRGVRHDRGFYDDAAREMAGDMQDRVTMAPSDPVAELPAHLDLLAQRSQRLQPSGPGLHRHLADQAGHRVADIPDARLELAGFGGPSLPAQPRLN